MLAVLQLLEGVGNEKTLDSYLLTSDRTIKLRGLIYEISVQVFVLPWKKKAQYLLQCGQTQQ